MAGSGSTWFKYGCFGCLGLVGVAILACAAMLTVAWMSVRSERIESPVLTPELPGVEILGEDPAGGTVVVEIAQTGLVLKPAAPGEPLRVEASYDANVFVLEESLDPGSSEGEPWSYRVAFRRAGDGGVMDALKQLMSGSSPQLEVYLPSDRPIDLGIDVEQGGAAVRLDGLWLTSADIEFQQGGLDLRIEEPLRQPAERMSIRGSMGGGNLAGLGNASPRILDVEYSMGGMQIDLRGLWLTDSEITINGSMGGGTVWLPRDVTLEGLDRDQVETPVETELPPPTLRFNATSAMGELKFID